MGRCIAPVIHPVYIAAMPGQSKLTNMLSLRAPAALIEQARADAAKHEQSLGSWIVGAMWARLADGKPSTAKPPRAQVAKPTALPPPVPLRRSKAPICSKCGFILAEGRCTNKGCK